MTAQYDFLKTWLTAHCRTERGASLVEYALLVALIAVAAIAAMKFLASGANSKMSDAGNELSAA
jgi:pilus assembly protein Flp/PilA